MSTTHPRTAVRSKPRSLLILGCTGIAVFAVLAVGVSQGVAALQQLDDAWRAIVGAPPGAESTPLSMFFQVLGSNTTILIASSVVPLCLLALGRWRTAVFAVLLMSVNGAFMNYLLKVFIARERPAEGEGVWGPLIGHTGFDSFPSGHTAFTATLAVIAVVATTGRTRVVMALVGIAIMAGMVWQRTMINAHWLSDTLGSVAAIWGLGALAWWALYGWLLPEKGLPVVRWRRPATVPLSLG